MADSTLMSENRLNMIRNTVEAGLGWCATFHYPTPITDEDGKWQYEAAEALDQARLAWGLAISLIGCTTPCDLSVPGRLNSELAKVIYNFHCFKDAPFPPRGENLEVDLLLDVVERTVDRAWDILRNAPKSQ